VCLHLFLLQYYASWPNGLDELKQYARSQQQQNGNGHPPLGGNGSGGLVSNKVAEGADVKTPLVR
jgi:hypothetical protein